MNQTNRADAAQKYLESLGHTKPRMQIEFQFKTAMPSGPWWRDKELRLAKLPRMRYINNMGVYQLIDERGVRVFGNDIESTYLLWIEHEFDRNACEDLSDFPAFNYEGHTPPTVLRTLGWSAFGLLIVFAMSALCYVVNR